MTFFVCGKDGERLGPGAMYTPRTNALAKACQNGDVQKLESISGATMKGEYLYPVRDEGALGEQQLLLR